MVKRRKTSDTELQSSLLSQRTPPVAPDFAALLAAPLVRDHLPSDFDREIEARHLTDLWGRLPELWNYVFLAFVHAGGSGLVFRVHRKTADTDQALKIVRRKLLSRDGLPQDAARSLSPVSERELRALEKLSHPHVVRLYDAISSEEGVVAIATTYVSDPQPLDGYLRSTLARTPGKGTHAFSPQRLDHACSFLLERCLEIAEALHHMHGSGIFHLDIKPANILISADRRAVLTDLGACVHEVDLNQTRELRVHFTWTYAHPDLTSMLHQPASISGGGLKASASVAAPHGLARFDLFAFGRTLQEALAILEFEFGERSYVSYGFRYLHLVAALLLDGRNAPSSQSVIHRDGRRFVSDTALEYPVALFQRHKITTAQELMERLQRYSREYSWHAQIPELDPWQPRLLNTGIGEPAPFTERVSTLLGHPALRRLKSEAQLGWIREVYPGATHNRWSHTIGVFAALVRYYTSILADPEVPTLRLLLDPLDLSHAMLAAILHDVGQVGFGHDLEGACPHLFDHEKMVERLLDETGWGEESLRTMIGREWPKVDLSRVMKILRRQPTERPIDGVAQDIVDGPIDADKIDYLIRDSAGCGVPYGLGIDTLRFLQALSVDASSSGSHCKLCLAYKAKGSAAIESLLLARYQMYGAVYWHHTFRCIQAMFSHAASSTFGALRQGRRKLRNSTATTDTIRELLYQWVICGKTLTASERQIKARPPSEFFDEPPASLGGERLLEFVWKFSEDGVRRLLDRLGRRDLYKRVYEVKVSDLGHLADYSALRSDLNPERRPSLAGDIGQRFLDAIHKTMAERGPRESVAEDRARERLHALQGSTVPLVVIDFPTRGIPEELNFPPELGDPARKYIAARHSDSRRGRIFHVVRELQTQKAMLRVFAAPELHELIVRYLDTPTVEACVGDVVPRIRTTA